MTRLKRILADFVGLCRVCGLWVGVRWLAAILTHWRACRRAGNLQPADVALGEGPFAVRMRGARARLTGDHVLTGIREIWVRDVYLGHGYLTIPPSGTVVDLGTNMGALTTLALAHGNQVRVVAVEADPAECLRLRKNLELNGWIDRAAIVNAFVGGHTHFQQQLALAERSASVSTVSEQELLDRAGGRISFLKCDIEGSEFQLFNSGSPLLAASDQIAIEIHPDEGNSEQMLELLKAAGFKLQIEYSSPTVTVLGRR